MDEKINIQLSIDTENLLIDGLLTAEAYKTYCFKKNPYLFLFDTNEMLEEPGDLVLLRTHGDNYIAVNPPVLSLMDCFDGETNLESLFEGLPEEGRRFLVSDVTDDNKSEFLTLTKEEFCVDDGFDVFFRLVGKLYRAHLIVPVDIRWEPVEPVFPSPTPRTPVKPCKPVKPGSAVLLLGDTTGTATAGLLYLASYLRRNGVEAYCQWNDTANTPASLREHTRDLLEKFRPRLVGVSMKWFPHMARVFEICGIVKAYDPGVTVVVGGNSASYYYRHIIENPAVDYVVRGDGEKPFLDICLGRENIPNAVYKKEGKIIETPITYVHDEKNTSDIFLSHLDDIFVSKKDIYSVKNFYINTGKGCSMSCFYCAGGVNVQKHSFNREKPFIRGIDEVRKDLETVKKYTSGFMFDFDLPLYDSLDYYKQIWEGIDLSRYFCEFYFWTVPSAAFIQLAAGTFKHVLLSIDMCSLSEPHRLRLAESGLVKPQPTDEEIISFFDICETYPNVEVQVTPILGLPYFSEEDITRGRFFISRLIENYSPFRISWGRLHAQPGADLSESAGRYRMVSYAKGYDDFMQYSRLNMEAETYPDLDSLNYPYIYSEDSELNRKTGQYFMDIGKMINRRRELREKRFIISRSVAPGALHAAADQLVGLLREEGVGPGSIKNSDGDIDAVNVLDAAGAYYHNRPRVRRILDTVITPEKKANVPLLAEDTQLDEKEFDF